MRALPALVLLLAIPFSSCKPYKCPSGSTCMTGVYFQIGPTLKALEPGDEVFAHACIDDDCVDDTLFVDGVGFITSARDRFTSYSDRTNLLYEAINLDPAGPHKVVLLLKKGDVVLEDIQKDSVTFQGGRPDGPKCPAKCWEARVEP